MSIIRKNNTYATITNATGSIWVALLALTAVVVYGFQFAFKGSVTNLIIVIIGTLVLLLSLYLNKQMKNGRIRLERDFNFIRTGIMSKKVDTASKDHLIDLGDVLQKEGKQEYYIGFEMETDDYNSRLGQDENDKTTYGHLDEHDIAYIDFTRSLPVKANWTIKTVKMSLPDIDQFNRLGIEIDQSSFEQYKYYLIGRFDNLQKYEVLLATASEILKDFKIKHRKLDINELITAITA